MANTKTKRSRSRGGAGAGTGAASVRDRAGLLDWVRRHTGVRLADRPACCGHHAPADYFSELALTRPPLALVLGPRGGGKSFLSALDTHFTSCRDPKHATRILGGSRSQSLQIYLALRELAGAGADLGGPDADAVEKLMKDEAVYHNGSHVSILAASSTSVRGPHVPSLKLDELDELPSDLRDAALGMCMNRRGAAASVVMTSTWHRPNGPMAEMMARADDRERGFPFYRFCVFDVLETCPESRSGRRVGGDALYENCPACPLKPWCHSQRDRNGDEALAKRADGHYAIDALVQKLRVVSTNAFEADYLCRGPRMDGNWFKSFDPNVHVTERAGYVPGAQVHVAIDSGVFTGAVFFQVVTSAASGAEDHEVRVFADYLTEGVAARDNARELRAMADRLCQGRVSVFATDPAGGARNAIGPSVLAEYVAAELKPLRQWPVGPVGDGLALVESFLSPADGRPRLIVHPRCEATIQALRHYRRARRRGQWMDYPEDPQHPYEDLVDALRGGLLDRFPHGRVQPTSAMTQVPCRRVV